MSTTPEQLQAMAAEKEFFIGLDSDGCIFDSMEPKHKECFCPTTIWKWNLEAVSKYAREAWDFVNLYGRARGCNRFLALLSTLDHLRVRDAVLARRVEIPALPDLRAWVERESKLGNPALEAEIERSGSEELRRVLDWSLAINEAVERIVREVPPFPQVDAALAKAAERADLMVVSSTPYEALAREWAQYGIDRHVRAIAGQEVGKKDEQIRCGAGGRYAAGRMLMLGDAYSDRKAIKAHGGLFYPILPGREEESWERFADEALDRFFDGTFAGAYEDALSDDLARALPESPPWGA